MTHEKARAVLQANFIMQEWESKAGTGLGSGFCCLNVTLGLIPRLNEQVPVMGKRMVFVQSVNAIDQVVQEFQYVEWYPSLVANSVFRNAGELDTIGVHANSHFNDPRVVCLSLTCCSHDGPRSPATR